MLQKVGTSTGSNEISLHHLSSVHERLLDPVCSLPQLLEGITLALEKGVAEHKVKHKDSHKRDDYCTGGGLAHALGAT
jgi:hypothetical protein